MCIISAIPFARINLAATICSVGISPNTDYRYCSIYLVILSYHYTMHHSAPCLLHCDLSCNPFAL